MKTQRWVYKQVEEKTERVSSCCVNDTKTPRRRTLKSLKARRNGKAEM
jgi:hypothetical protein